MRQFKIKIVLILAFSMMVTGNVFALPIKNVPGGFEDFMNGSVYVNGEPGFVSPANNSGIPNALEKVVESPGFELVIVNQIRGNPLAMYYLAIVESYGSWSTYEAWASALHGVDGGIQAASNSSVQVPEPAATLLLGAGLVGLALFCRKNRKKLALT